MATDSAELTFVRCRSCGALVPATAAKCRICNAALESGAKADDSGDAKGASGRVRQRTMSASSGDVMDVVSKLRDEPPAAAGGNDGDDDPLGAYLEEVEDDAGSSSAAADPLGEVDDDFDLDDEPTGPASTKRMFDVPDDDEDFGMAPIEEPPPAPKRGGRAMDEARGSRGPKLQPRLRSDEESRGAPQRPSRPIASAAKIEPKSRASSAGTVIVSGQEIGQLVGWLVSYKEAEGHAIELREGKLFVTGSPFKGSDLLLDDPSVSTPHALLSISVQNGIRVQDFMSDQGLFSRSGKSGEYQRTEGPIALKHGDWIKFGDVEFLVCSVAKADGK